ncbi:zinc finger and BTB domain-containing protein 8A [Harmonia axyridis]|uniref:zinc finger and BTB domain-containing protein 8A n=1 Tax=Harmonia axyridis TaxID=115357 RepID=UPI001E274F86|nr:zinc finger and BTB domain-containing protein 8A [Harmonia axyridis]
MYSLYRAWLQFGTPGLAAGFQNAHALQQVTGAPLNIPPPNQPPSAPDVSLQVGPSMTHFSAHKAILTAHSGYFKAALVNHTDTEPISVPNVNVDEFSYLLTFMYTGYLDLNIRNIYNILLATHILHMPTALEICRSFLLQTQNVENRTNVIKPIASRKALVPTQPIYAPNNTAVLPKSEDTPFTIVRQPEKLSNTLNQASTSKANLDREPTPSQLNTRSEKKGIDKSRMKRRTEPANSKVIIDVACCDGPVRFHRVVNKNYGLRDSVDDRVDQQQEVNANDALNKAMAENIRDKPVGDENSGGNELFTCLYCNHTFKSQYCYQKHARRHLNPVSVEAKAVTKELKREVKLLDMNVQYYPCKTCGSKFPSYYFVHKHRKMCHAEEMADLTNRNNEIVMERSDEADRASTNSSIDVEALNSDHNEGS